MHTLTGVLVFSGSWLNRPWTLIQQDKSEIDLYPFIDEILKKLNGKPAEHQQSSESYSLTLNDSAEMVVKYETDNIAMLEKPGGFGMSNIEAYLPKTLTWLSGRKVEIEFNDNGFKIVADPNEQVLGVKFFSHGNNCHIPEGAEESVCKLRTSNCCIFMTTCSDGLACEKFGGMGAMLLARRFRGTMRATRVGNCALVGGS